ncbi:MAG: HD domain-containing protein [Lachnospiraceae bacterium]|nr:HD domain-containing protein [Lachnospiraceae bacterium]
MICDLSDELSHGVLVSNLAYRLAKELELPEDFCYHMSVAGMMHDVGKLEIWQYLHQDEDQRLEIERTRYTRTHPTLGYLRLLNEGFDPFVCEAVLHHHENYDGTGYPDNLKGEEIPLGARILRVCDVFAALVSDRPYRRAFSTETAMELLIDEVEHFDMWIFLAFQRVVAAPEFKEIHLLIKDYNEGYNRIRESARRQQIEGEESV